MKKIAIVGSSLASVVTSAELAVGNNQVDFYPLNNPEMSGFFSGAKCGKYRIDLGMNFIEFATFNQEEKPNPLSYRSDVRNDSGRFSGVVKKYLESKDIHFEKVITPKMFVDGNYFDDLIIANGSEWLRSDLNKHKNIIKQELEAVLSLKDDRFHPKNKISSKDFKQTTYEQVSMINHGSFIHNHLIKPFIKKLLPNYYNKIAALYHRTAWAPLFYPESLYEVITTNVSQVFDKTEFHYPTIGYLGVVPEVLSKNLKNFNIIQGSISIDIQNDNPKIICDNNQYVYDELIIAVSPYKYLGGVDPLQQLPKELIEIVTIVVPLEKLKQLLSTVNIIDSDLEFYRLTMQNNGVPQLGNVVISFERGLKDSNQSKETTIEVHKEKICKTLIHMNLVNNILPSEIEIINIQVAGLAVPVVESISAIEEYNSMASKPQKGIHFISNASHFGTSAFNDQIIQGLKLSQKISKETNAN